MNLPICPKCGHQRQLVDRNIHPDICPSCGISYSKWRARQRNEDAKSKPHNREYAPDKAELGQVYTIETFTLKQQLIAPFSYVPEKVTIEALWGRFIVFLVFLVWGVYFVTAGVSWEKLGVSFMHNVNLPFHEFGHILFMPFGRFMMILGGSLFQVLLPLLLMFAFVFKQRDTFAGSIMLWWCGQSFMDLSPYIADAQYRALPLVGGGGEESHDWGNLLTMMNLLPQTQSIAKGCFLLGAFILIGALIWSAFILHQQKHRCQNGQR